MRNFHNRLDKETEGYQHTEASLVHFQLPHPWKVLHWLLIPEINITCFWTLYKCNYSIFVSSCFWSILWVWDLPMSFIYLCCYLIFYSMAIPKCLSYLWWTVKLFPVFGYRMWWCWVHSCTCLLVTCVPLLLGIYSGMQLLGMLKSSFNRCCQLISKVIRTLMILPTNMRGPVVPHICQYLVHICHSW